MTKSRFKIAYIGYCEPMGKVWGWTVDRNSNIDYSKYIFFAHVGKTITLKRLNRYGVFQNIDQIRNQKIKNHYVEITVNDLLNLWPTFMTDLENKFTFDLLAEKFSNQL